MNPADSKNLVRIAIVGALAAIFVDWFLKPSMFK